MNHNSSSFEPHIKQFAIDLAGEAIRRRDVSGKTDSPSQVQNLLEYALSGAIAQEIDLFVKYQQSRHQLSPAFAQMIIKHVEDICTSYASESQDVIALYFGYLRRMSRLKEVQ